MTQKEAIKNIIESMDNRLCSIIFVSNWLEDINWHSENTMLVEKLSKEQTDKWEVMRNLNYIIHSSNYSDVFVDEFKQTEEAKLYIEAVRYTKENKANGYWVRLNRWNNFISKDEMFSYNKAETFYNCFNYIWGWGITTPDWVSGGSGQKFVDELWEMITNHYDEKEKQDELTRRAYQNMND